jgi:uncharacterized repeat protein (TIGR01451 family)
MAAVVCGGMLQNSAAILAQTTPANSIQINNQASYTYTDSNNNQQIEGISSQILNSVEKSSLTDPFGHIKGCNGEVLSDYTGFSVSLYDADPSDPTGTSLKGLVPLTRTEVPDAPDNNIPLGLVPNKENSNPYYLTNGSEGTYNFLFDPNQGQLDAGRTYILVINPPADSIYDQRRVKLTLNELNGDILTYTATSLDGKPISATGENQTSATESVNIRDAARLGLILSALNIDAGICQEQELEIVKTGDRAAAQPGDTIVYHLLVRNLSSASLNNVTVTDNLPLGFNLVPKSVRAELGDTPVQIATSHNGSTVNFRLEGASLPTDTTGGEVLNIAYAAVLTPDSVRGSGENSAIVTGQRFDNNQLVKDGPATHKLRIDPGILADCGTLIGRVFVDKNFDGEQQRGEPGVPNAVIFLDDGNRITTDPNGLFSVANVVSGYRTGVLDLSSLSGYTLAPNRRFIERNSQSRLVHLEPGGLARMNFAVTPTFREAKPNEK